MNNNKKINLVFFSDFGSRKGKSRQLKFTYEALKKEGILKRTYIRDIVEKIDNESKKNIVKSIPFGFFIPKFLSGIKKFLFPSFISRIWSERIFDFFTSIKLLKSDILYVSLESLKCIKKAKKEDTIIIKHCDVLHPEYNFNITKEEFNNFDIEPNKPFLEELNKRSNEIDIYNYFIVRSKYGRDNYINHGIDPARIFINQLGIDHEKFVPNNKYTEERKKTFVFIGKVSLLKGAHYLLEAWKQLDLEDSKLIIGGDKEINDWNNHIKKYKNIKNVEFVGRVDPSEYYTKGIAFILPSLTEGSPRVVAEAISSGVPVITTPVGAETIREEKMDLLFLLGVLRLLKKRYYFFIITQIKLLRWVKRQGRLPKNILGIIIKKDLLI
jgi:glycosyltransferase involved in cell wall biosynthesis